MIKRKATAAHGEAKQVSPLLRGMMSNSGVNPAVTRSEGHAVTLTPLPGYSSDNQAYAMDMLNAPVPARRYAADLCGVSFVHDELRITFAQQGYEGSDELESAIVLRMNSDAALNFIDSLADLGLADDIMAKGKLKREEVFSTQPRTQKTVPMMANICSVAMAGKESCMDFYHASAFAIRKAEKENSIEVEPVVRVDLRSSLFVALIRRANQIAEQIRNEGEAL
jgi:hypothetical protein